MAREGGTVGGVLRERHIDVGRPEVDGGESVREVPGRCTDNCLRKS
jgi:hypothetical protein